MQFKKVVSKGAAFFHLLHGRKRTLAHIKTKRTWTSGWLYYFVCHFINTHSYLMILTNDYKFLLICYQFCFFWKCHMLA